MSHTRGPWHRNIRAGGKYPVVFAGRNQHVATVCQQATPEETEANIDLIASAPELLEALQVLRPGLVLDLRYADDDDDIDALRARVKTVESAIAKATGAPGRAP